MTLTPDERIVTAWAERCSGPGYGNTPVWVLVRSSRTGAHRVDCLQPDEQSGDIRTLFAVSVVVADEMTRAVERCVAAGGDRP